MFTISFCNPILKRFILWSSIYVVIWVIFGVCIGALLNPELNGHPTLTDIEEHNLISSARAFLALSFSIDGLILFVYCICPSVRQKDVSFVICLIAADFFNMLARFISSFGLEDKATCQATGTILAYFSLCAVLWIYILSFYLYHRIIQNVPPSDFGNTKIAFHVLGWGAPVVPALCGLGAGMWGPAGAWCWVSHDYPAFRLFYFYIPALETFLISAYCFAKIITKIKSVVNEEGSTLKTSAHLRLSIYLVVFCFFNLWGLAFRISNIVDPDHFIMWLYYIHHSERACAGAWDGIIFGYAFWGEIRKIYFSSKVTTELPMTNTGHITTPHGTDKRQSSKGGSNEISGSV